jgi:carboxylesterase type B
MGFKLSAVGAISVAGGLLASTILVSADPMMPLPGDPLATASGKVSGTRLSSGVKAYFGIPFAKPPTGDLRWKPPQPISWDGVWNADRKGPECIQVLRAHDINHYFGEEPTSEDCLYLNLWAPGEAKPGDVRPVIVFIYGGGGTLGSSGMANYGGANMAKRGAIFVNFNYRVGLSVPGVRAPYVVDGYFWTGTKEQAFASHQASDVPVIASSNGDDLDSARYPLTRARNVADYQAMARQMYGAAADQFLQLYPAQTDADVQPMAHRAAMENGMMMNSRRCGEVQAQYGTAPVYIDTFVRKHPYAPDVRIADQNTATVGAYHTGDVPYWFDTLDAYNWQRSTRMWTPYDRELTDRMAGALIAFAETGKPSTPQLNWPAWSAQSPQYMVFGDTAAVQTMDLKRMDWLAAHPPAPANAQSQRTGARD